MKVFVGILLIVLFALSTPTLAADAKAGKTVYDSKCKVCHGAGGEGNAALAKTLKVEFRHLGSKEVQAKTDEQLKETFLKGTAKKKPVAGLSDQQVGDVIAFLRSIAKS